MKNFKRLTALVLAVLMLISTVACGSSAANDSTTQAASTSAFDVMSSRASGWAFSYHPSGLPPCVYLAPAV